MGQLLSHPLTEKTIIYNDYSTTGNHHHHKAAEHNGSSATEDKPRFSNCIGSMQGYRLTQEDAHMAVTGADSLDVSFYDPFLGKVERYQISVFGVFDGHGDNNCSNYLAGTLYEHPHSNTHSSNGQKYSEHDGLIYFIKSAFESHNYTSSDRPDGNKKQFKTIEGLICQVIKDSFKECDAVFHRHFANEASGSTAIVALIINGSMLYVANTGDSRCILSKKKKGIKTMSYDHKPQHIGELIRINDDGGTVSLGRVGGVLALSRAFGDFQFKRNVKYPNTSSIAITSKRKFVPAEEAQVTVEPDVIPHLIDTSQDEFLVLACDGIWDVYSNKALVRFIKYHLALGLKLDGIITKLLDHGISCADSNTGVGFDNFTLIVVALQLPGETLDEWYARMKFRLEREKGLL
ncbi:PPM-type phosphatase domain-containing protein [Kluyveromyces marxianus]